MSDSYEKFLMTKAIVFKSNGITVDRGAIHPLLFPFQNDLTRWSIRKGRCALFADTGLGKALSVDTPVLTPSGYRLMGELRIGDRVIGSDGKPHDVTGVYPQGKRPAYQVSFSDGTSTICDLEHLWSVRTKVQKHQGQNFQPRSLREILDIGLVEQEGWKWFIPMVQPVEFTGVELPLDPYLLGALIGDGSLSTNMPVISSADDGILSRVANALPIGIGLLKNGDSYDWRIGHGSRNGHRRNPVTSILRNLGLMGKKSESKFIPEIYKFATLPEREALLQGILDTDGHVRPADNNIEFLTVSRQLADDVVFLVQSLGGTARIREKKTTGQLAYRMSIALPESIKPFWLERKAVVYHPRKKYSPTRAIVAAEQVDDTAMVCITVDVADCCYVIEHCIVTHNTLMQLEWARLLGQKTLIVAPLSVARQTVRMAKDIDITVKYVRNASQVTGGINITNYEMLDAFDPTEFGAVVLDESGILKSLDGATRQKLIEMFAVTPYRLCCTATPAPNDISEIANHAEFLGIMTRADLLATFFVHDDEGWRLKGHAHKAFFKWLASWAMSVRKPSDLGYADDGYILPPLTVEPVWVQSEYQPTDALFFTEMKGLGDRLAIRKATLEARVAKAAELVNASSEQWIVWCGLNEESHAMTKAIPGAVEVEGADSLETKTARLEAFQDGAYRVLVSKAKIAGFGMNFQNAHNQVFVGLNDSWEGYYQCIRRSYRYGQTQPVNIKIVLSEIEEAVYQNVMRKEREAQKLGEELILNVTEFEHEELGNVVNDAWKYETDTQHGTDWTMHLGDSSQKLYELPPNSVDLSIYSPPFLSLYTYSPTERDLGNSRTSDDFFAHYGYIIRGILQATKPGRLTCVHVADVPAMLVRDGYIGLKDFPGDCIRAYEANGWIWSGRVCIAKNPQSQAIRSHSKALLFAQLHKDASWSRPALLDQILIFRKPGENATPIIPDIGNDTWISWASGTWQDVRESDTLQYMSVRSEEDERHLCPLQLGTIERCIRLWSNPGETVLSPFAGIGSEGYTALKLGRKFIGIELKREYWKQACANLKAITDKKNESTLFDFGMLDAHEIEKEEGGR